MNRVKPRTAAIPPGLEYCKTVALQLISISGTFDFKNDEDWGKWCRAVAGGGLMQDPDRLARLAKDAGYEQWFTTFTAKAKPQPVLDTGLDTQKSVNQSPPKCPLF